MRRAIPIVILALAAGDAAYRVFVKPRLRAGIGLASGFARNGIKRYSQG